MKNMKKHLEIAFAEAMYQEMYMTANLIATALETLGDAEGLDAALDEKNVVDEGESRAAINENIVYLPCQGG